MPKGCVNEEPRLALLFVFLVQHCPRNFVANGVDALIGFRRRDDVDNLRDGRERICAGLVEVMMTKGVSGVTI
jgi:hypothetical protein